MNLPSAQDLYDTIEHTWPPHSQTTVGPWTIRVGAGGGKRVSSATLDGQIDAGQLATAEAAMASLDQPPLFMIREDDETLDRALADRGYKIVDPVLLYVCPTTTLTAQLPPPVSGFTVWPPLEIMKEIWAEGGVGAGRLAVMDRVSGPKTAILARGQDRAAGCAFVAIHGNIAMIHAIEVLPTLRRKGVGINILRHAAHWAQDQGADFFSLVVTNANTAANMLYSKLGMTVVGKYHYRMKQKD